MLGVGVGVASVSMGCTCVVKDSFLAMVSEDGNGLCMTIIFASWMDELRRVDCSGEACVGGVLKCLVWEDGV